MWPLKNHGSTTPAENGTVSNEALDGMTVSGQPGAFNTNFQLSAEAGASIFANFFPEKKFFHGIRLESGIGERIFFYTPQYKKYDSISNAFYWELGASYLVPIGDNPEMSGRHHSIQWPSLVDGPQQFSIAGSVGVTGDRNNIHDSGLGQGAFRLNLRWLFNNGGYLEIAPEYRGLLITDDLPDRTRGIPTHTSDGNKIDQSNNDKTKSDNQSIGGTFGAGLAFFLNNTQWELDLGTRFGYQRYVGDGTYHDVAGINGRGKRMWGFDILFVSGLNYWLNKGNSWGIGLELSGGQSGVRMDIPGESPIDLTQLVLGRGQVMGGVEYRLLP